MKSSILFLCLAVVSTNFLCADPVCAQQDTIEEPKAAARAYPALLGATGEQSSTSDQEPGLTPDSTPLTGLQTPTLGSPTLLHSYWVPGFQYTGMFQSQNLNTPGPGWTANHYMVGSLSLLDAWSHAQLSLNYYGGGFISNDKALGSGSYQQFGVTQDFNFGRLQVRFLDQFSYLPESQFGFGGATNLATPGAGGTLAPSLPGLSTNISPNQSIFSAVGPRYSNAFAPQITYDLSPRGSVTVAGSYGILRFVDGGNFGNDNLLGSFGYNYVLTPRDSIGVVYRFSTFHFAGNPQAIGDQTASFAYSRKITGRLALQLEGGPDFTQLRIPVSGKSSLLSGSGRASLNYAFQRGGLALSYNHGVTGGAGILVGSSTDYVTLTGNRQISQRWNATGSFGYAANRSIANVLSANTQQTFNSWFITAGLTRLLTPDANFVLGYTARFQTSSAAVCPSPACAATFTQHQISVGFQWSARPMVIR
jgi:hypothetical protein